MLHAGAFVSIGHDGSLSVERGYVRSDDLAAIQADDNETSADDHAETDASTPATVITVAGQGTSEEEDEDELAPLPERLLVELTAHRTLALRNAVADNPQVAFRSALIYEFLLRTLGGN